MLIGRTIVRIEKIVRIGRAATSCLSLLNAPFSYPPGEGKAAPIHDAPPVDHCIVDKPPKPRGCDPWDRTWQHGRVSHPRFFSGAQAGTLGAICHPERSGESPRSSSRSFASRSFPSRVLASRSFASLRMTVCSGARSAQGHGLLRVTVCSGSRSAQGHGLLRITVCSESRSAQNHGISKGGPVTASKGHRRRSYVPRGGRTVRRRSGNRLKNRLQWLGACPIAVGRKRFHERGLCLVATRNRAPARARLWSKLALGTPV
jgi:hypothetical protein